MNSVDTMPISRSLTLLLDIIFLLPYCLAKTNKKIPSTPDNDSTAQNTPILLGNKPIVTRYAVKTTPDGLKAVKCSDARGTFTIEATLRDD